MAKTLRRRGFMAAVGTAGLGACTDRTAAIDRVARSGKAPWRLSLAGYSMRKYLTHKPGSPGAMDLMGFATYAADVGFDGIEPTSYYFPNEDVRTFVHRLKRHCLLLGLDISSGAVRNNFTLPPGEELDHWFDHVQRWVDLYADLGVPVIRVFAGKPPSGMPHEQAIANSITNIQRACELSGQRGVVLALENHDFLTDVTRMLKIVRGVKSPWFGVNWDSGNFASQDPYADLEKVAPYAVTAQIKVKIYGAGGKKVPADLARILDILRRADYRGSIVLEYEAAEDPYTAIPRYADRLRSLMAAGV